jgi:hypothetical protein
MKYVNLFEQFITESTHKILDKKAIIKIGDNYGFSAQVNDDYDIILSTRQNRDVGSETYSKIDLNNAYKLYNELEKKFPELTLEVETVDEWVHVNVSIKEPEYLQADAYKNQIPKIENYLESILSSIPYYDDRFAIELNTYHEIPHYPLQYFKHQLNVDLTTEEPQAKKAKDITKFIKKIEKDFYKKFKIQNYEVKGLNNNFNVEFKGGAGWLYIIINSPYFKQ